MSEPLVMSVRKTARLLSLSETAVTNAITRGELRATKIGRRVLVNVEDVSRKLLEAGVRYVPE
jgi:excisionase family DNA binding protein